MGFALPSGVVNTDSAYFYADATFKLGPLIKEPSEQTLVVIDYSQLPAPFALKGSSYTLDVATNPALVVSYPNITTIGNVLTFLLSGGIVGQQYNLSVAVQYLAANGLTVSRTDVLTVNMPSSGDCACEIINPVPAIQTQAPLGSEGWVNTAVRYFWGATPPANPGVLDQWYNPDTQALYEWVTDGVTFFWDILAAPDFVLEAPIDGTIYSRYNGFWIPDIIQADVPMDGQNYVRYMQQWRAVPPSMPDAPVDGVIYGRKDMTWVSDIIQQDAPDDGNAYARANNGWVFAPVTPITSDAPNDGRLYNRQGSAKAGVWVPDPIQEDSPQDGNLYGRLSGTWVQAYPVTNPSNYQNQAQVVAAVATGVAPMMPRAGGTFTGGVQFNVGAIFPTTAQLVVGGGNPGDVLSTNGANALTWTAQSGGIPEAPQDGTTYARNNATWVHISASGGIPEAPSDGQLYGRLNAAWSVVPSSSGGISDAPTDGTAYIRKSASWQRPVHTDITDWTATLAPYALTANVPAGSNTNPIMDGTATAGAAATFSRADHVHPSDTSRYAASNPAGYIPDAPSDGNQYTRRNAAWAAIAIGPPVTMSATAPSSPVAGALWWDIVGGQLYVYYNDGNSSQWVATNSGGPTGATTTPLMDGTAAIGIGTTWARADHVHPSDTSRYAASNPAGYQTAAQVTTSLGAYLPLTGGTLSGQLTVNSALTVSGNNLSIIGGSLLGSGVLYPNYSANSGAYISSAAGSITMLVNGSNYFQSVGGAAYIVAAGVTMTWDGTTLTAANLNTNGINASTMNCPTYYNNPTFTGNVAINGVATVGSNATVGGTLTVNNAANIYGNVVNVRQTSAGLVQVQFVDSNGTGRVSLAWRSSDGMLICQNQVGGGWFGMDQGNQFQTSVANAFKAGGGPWAASSDIRIKTVHREYTQGLDDVLKLRPVIYSYKGNDTTTGGEPTHRDLVAKTKQKFVGLVAQEVENIFPTMVVKNAGIIDGVEVDDLRCLDTTELIFALINSIKTLAARVTTLEAAQ